MDAARAEAVTIDTIIDVAVPVAVFVMMFALGLGLTVADFRLTLKRPKALLVGVASQIVLVPVVGFLFVSLLQQDADLALGIVLLALCPSAAMSNLLTRIAGGDVALSVSLRLRRFPCFWEWQAADSSPVWSNGTSLLSSACALLSSSRSSAGPSWKSPTRCNSACF